MLYSLSTIPVACYFFPVRHFHRRSLKRTLISVERNRTCYTYRLSAVKMYAILLSSLAFVVICFSGCIVQAIPNTLRVAFAPHVGKAWYDNHCE